MKFIRACLFFIFLPFCSLASETVSCNENPEFCHNLAVAYYGGDGVEQNLTLSYEYFKEACDSGFLQSCFNVGLMSLNGDGTQKDEFVAFDMFKKTCMKDKKGYKTIDGCLNLAMLYIDGLGVRQDFKKGLEILDDVCRAGVLQACKSLSMIYQDGYLAIDSNATKSLEILKFACDEKKDAESFVEVSTKLFENSDKNALEYLKKGCEFGLAEACLDVGLMYTNAQFVEQNLTIAKEFFGKACDLRNTKGCESYRVLNLQEIESKKIKK